MVLSAFLSLDAAGFLSPLGMAQQGIAMTTRLLGDMAARIEGAFDFGSDLEHLSRQTGQAAGELLVLRQAFEDTGVGGGNLQRSISMLQRSLVEAQDGTGRAAQGLARLGLDAAALRTQGAREQMESIGAAIRGIEDPAARTAAAMEIFGRSGAEMMSLLMDEGAIGASAAALGSMPDLIDRNAAAFEAVSTRLGHIRAQGQGLWLGIAEGMLPLAESVSSLFDGLDLAAIGQRIGAFLGTTVELFRTAPLGDILRDLLIIGIDEGVNYAANALIDLGGLLWRVLSEPLANLSAAYGKAISQIMEWIGRIPRVGRALGIEGFEADAFADMRDDSRAFFQGIAQDALNTKITLVDTSAERALLASAWHGAADDYAAKLERIQEDARLAAPDLAGVFGDEMADQAGKIADATRVREPTIPTDQLTRIGGFVGDALAARAGDLTGGAAGDPALAAGPLARLEGIVGDALAARANEMTAGAAADPAVAADPLARLVGLVGGVQERIEALNERTAKATERMALLLERGFGEPRVAVWGSA